MMTTYFISFLLFLVCFAGAASGQMINAKQCSLSACPPDEPTFCTADVVPVYCFPDNKDLTKYNTYGNCCDACNAGEQDNCFEVEDASFLP